MNAHMRRYRIHPFDAEGSVLDPLDALCESDHEALSFASWILHANTQAEVWRESRMIGAVSGRYHWAL